MHSHHDHVKKTEAAVTASTPEERFDQAMHAMKANYEACKTLEAKHEAIEAAFKDLAAIKVGIFDPTK